MNDVSVVNVSHSISVEALKKAGDAAPTIVNHKPQGKERTCSGGGEEMYWKFWKKRDRGKAHVGKGWAPAP